MTTGSSRRRAELFVRSLSPASARSPAGEQRRRLRDLAERDGLSDLSVTVWGREVGLSTTAARTEPGSLVLERVAAFRKWAEQRGVSMDPFFESREVRSELTGEEYVSLVLPTSCLAEYEDGDLVHVAPYCAESAVCSVADRVSSLEERARSGRRADRAEASGR